MASYRVAFVGGAGGLGSFAVACGMGNIVRWFGGRNVGGEIALLSCGHYSDRVIE